MTLDELGFYVLAGQARLTGGRFVLGIGRGIERLQDAPSARTRWRRTLRR